MTKTEQNDLICNHCKHPAHCGHSCMDDSCDHCTECACDHCQAQDENTELGYN